MYLLSGARKQMHTPQPHNSFFLSPSSVSCRVASAEDKGKKKTENTSTNTEKGKKTLLYYVHFIADEVWLSEAQANGCYSLQYSTYLYYS